MGHHLLRLILVGLVLLSGTACAAEPVATPQESVTLTIAGSTAMRPVLQALTGEFNRLHPQVLFSLRGGGSLLGETWVANGSVDLAASTLPQDGRETDPTLVRVPIGIDGVAVIVHPRNQVLVLTLLQLRDLYSGHLLSWADVGWASQDGGADVLLVSREDGSGTRRFFEEQVMGEERVALTAVVMPTSQDVIEYVAQRPQTIGYVSAAYLRDEQGDLRLVDPQQGGSMADLIGEYGENPVRIVPVEGLLPTQSNLADLQYHLSQPIFLVSQGEPTEWVRQFVDFALSPAGQQIVARFHGPVR